MPDWLDGRPASGVALHDRGLAYGDGLFETLAVRQGRPRLLERHLARLAEGCQRLGMVCDERLLRDELLAFSAELGEGVAKLILTRGDGLRGYAPSIQPARRLLLGSPVPAYPPEHRDGIRLFDCQLRLAEQPALAGLKHLNRLEQVLARREWQDPAYAEGLLLDSAGRVVECVFSNLFAVIEGVLITPSLERCGVAGVMRAELLERAQGLGLRVCVSDLSVDQLLAAQEVFCCNTQYGIWPVLAWRDGRWPVGALTRKLQHSIRPLLDA